MENNYIRFAFGTSSPIIITYRELSRALFTFISPNTAEMDFKYGTFALMFCAVISRVVARTTSGDPCILVEDSALCDGNGSCKWVENPDRCVDTDCQWNEALGCGHGGNTGCYVSGSYCCPVNCADRMNVFRSMQGNTMAADIHCCSQTSHPQNVDGSHDYQNCCHQIVSAPGISTGVDTECVPFPAEHCAALQGLGK